MDIHGSTMGSSERNGGPAGARRATRRPARRLALGSLLALLALGACGIDDDILPATVGDVAGSYRATRAVITESDASAGVTTHDVLYMGGRIEVELRADQTMEGRVLVPGAGDGGSDIDVDMHGTWELRAGAVRVRPEADTFMTNVAFVVKGRRLDGSYVRATSSTSEVRYEIMLDRQ